MKTFKISLIYIVMFVCLGIVSNCKSNDEPDPCGEFECLNGGIKITGVDGCLCDCPPNYTGANCETLVISCVDIGCPPGQSPNPNNDCVCE